MNSFIKSPARCTAVFGTGSDVGKSIVCTALCRMVSNLGLAVAPFKAQNMSNNSFVTIEGGEMGRAQIVQAEAARIESHVDMNPILLKPSTDTGSQVVLHGQPLGNRSAQAYWNDTTYLLKKALESLERLRSAYDVIIMEGAGSCGEVNLRDRDFVNFRMAHAADAPVILVADIDRGGVFAQIVGTLEVIPPEDRKRIKGIIINRFRGDAKLFADGITFIENKTGLPVLGLVPYFYHIDIDSEDGVILEMAVNASQTFERDEVNVGVLKLPHISNFTDFAVLQRDASINLRYLYTPQHLDGFDFVILPGTKNVRFDLEWLRKQGWERCLKNYVKNGGMLGGICGGYQMLGTLIRDPHGLEGALGETPGLGLLDMETILDTDKTLTRVSGIWRENGVHFEGYEIHMGKTTHNKNLSPAVRILSRNGEPVELDDGAVSENGRIWGCYIHGIFDEPSFKKAILKKLMPNGILRSEKEDTEPLSKFKDRQYNLLAEHFSSHINLPLLWKIIGLD